MPAPALLPPVPVEEEVPIPAETLAAVAAAVAAEDISNLPAPVPVPAPVHDHDHNREYDYNNDYELSESKPSHIDDQPITTVPTTTAATTTTGTTTANINPPSTHNPPSPTKSNSSSNLPSFPSSSSSSDNLLHHPTWHQPYPSDISLDVYNDHDNGDYRMTKTTTALASEKTLESSTVEPRHQLSSDIDDDDMKQFLGQSIGWQNITLQVPTSNPNLTLT